MNRWFSIARAISLMTTMAQYLSSLLVIQQICLFLDMVALTRTMLVHPQKLISSTKATAMTVVACFVPVVEEQLQHSLQAPPTMAAPTYSAHHRGCNRPVTSLLHPLRTSSHLWWSSLCRPTTDLSCVVTHGGARSTARDVVEVGRISHMWHILKGDGACIWSAICALLFGYLWIFQSVTVDGAGWKLRYLCATLVACCLRNISI